MVNIVTEVAPYMSKISVICPNIKHVRVYYDEMDSYYYSHYPIIYKIKNANLELLTWVTTINQDEIGNNFTVYIKLTTDNGTKYYTGNSNDLLSSSKQTYEQSLLSVQKNRE